METLEAEAVQGHVTVSQVIEAHLREHYQGGIARRLEHLESALNDLRAHVLPVVAKVAELIQHLEQEGQGLAPSTEHRQKVHVVTQEEMYGPITPMVEPKPRRSWP